MGEPSDPNASLTFGLLYFFLSPPPQLPLLDALILKCKKNKESLGKCWVVLSNVPVIY